MYYTASLVRTTSTSITQLLPPRVKRFTCTSIQVRVRIVTTYDRCSNTQLFAGPYNPVCNITLLSRPGTCIPLAVFVQHVYYMYTVSITGVLQLQQTYFTCALTLW